MTQAGSSDATALMDQMYRYQRHIYDLTRKFYLLGRDQLIAELDPPRASSILEIGCGTGRNLITIARAYPSAKCHGLDISDEMLRTARANVARAGLQDRIVLKQADATRFDPQLVFGQETFDRIVISYALSMIPPWQDVLRHAAALLSPGGVLLTVDFGDQAGLPETFKRVLNRWLAMFHVTPRASLPLDLMTIARDAGFHGGVRPLYRGYAFLGRISRT